MNAAFIVAIPARFQSSRLPGKVLQPLAGKPVLQHVYERGTASGAKQVVIATDDESVAAAARGFHAPVRITRPDHRSGTDRLAELAELLDWDQEQIVVNLQGDEPLIPAALLDRVAQLLADDAQAGIATLCTPISDADELFNRHTVKVVFNDAGYALYFSRAPIPWHRAGFAESRERLPQDGTWYRHIGLYAYRVRVLRRLASMAPPGIETMESLEQLRALHAGIPIRVGVIEEAPPAGVDTAEDLRRVEAILKGDS